MSALWLSPSLLSASAGLDVPGGAPVAALLAIAIAAVAIAGVRALRDHPRPRRDVLVALRVASAFAALLVAIQPTLTSEQTERSEGSVAVLLDVARSMRAPSGEGTRADRVSALAARWQRSTREAAVYGLGRGARVVRLADVATRALAQDDDTRFADALDAVGDPNVGAIIVVSDGIDLGGGAVAAASRAGARVHTIAVGAADRVRDDSIASLRADAVGFLRRPARVRVTLRRTGGAEGAVPVRLVESGRTLREVTALVPADGEAEIDIPFIPDRLGRIVYHVEIPTPDGDAVPENDARAFLVRVVRDNLRVLLVAGQPSWDQRFLRAFLRRDATTDLISFFILRSTSDMTMADPDELALIPFPTDELFQEHLGSFDVVLFQNFEYAPYQMAQYLPRIRDYVQRGGSFAMIGGPLSFAAAGYAETPIADILPVVVLPAGTPDARAITTDRFRPRIDDDAIRHPVLALRPNPAANREAWAALAPLVGLNVTTARPGSQLLLSHPTLRSPSGEALPVLVAGEAARGRVLALMTDTSWRWGIASAGQSGDASAYERFWDRAIRWLSRDPALDPARVTTDRERYGPGARVRVDAALSDARYVPLAARSVTLAILDGEGATLASGSARTDADGEAHATLDAPDVAGGYRVRASLEGEADALAEDVFVVEEGGDELADVRARPDLLRALAEATDGTYYADVGDAPELDAIDATRVRSLGVVTERPFASAWAFALLVALFGAEWIVRRRWGAR